MPENLKTIWGNLVYFITLLTTGSVGGVVGAYIYGYIGDEFSKKKERRKELTRLAKVMSDILADGEVYEFTKKPKENSRRAYRCASTLESLGYIQMASRLRNFVIGWELYTPRKLTTAILPDKDLDFLKEIVTWIREDTKDLQAGKAPKKESLTIVE